MQAARHTKTTEPVRQARGGAKVVMISLKAEVGWLKALAVDTELSHVAVRVALVMAQYFNGETGDTYVKQETIAAKISASERTTWAAIKELEDRGWIIVRRRELGTRASDGRRVCGGKGVANVYLPAVQRSQLTATNAASMLATHCDLSSDNGRNTLRPLEAQSSQSPEPKVAAHCDPTLTDPSDQNSARERARASGGARHSLGIAGDRLCARLGKCDFDAWFRDVQIEGIQDGVVRLSAPTHFLRDWIANHYMIQMIDCWKSVDRSTQHIEVVVRK